MQLIGRRTMVFTDVEGSTALLQRVGHPRYAELLDRHHHILRTAFRAHGGEEISNEGDALLALFPSALSGVCAAIDAQLGLAAEAWPDDGSIAVRMGVHEGEIAVSESGHHGIALHEGARIASAGHGGQVLVSEATRRSIESALPAGSPVGFRELGEFALKDIGPRVPLIQVTHPGMPARFPSPRTAGGSRHNLPAQLTDLVGRDHAAHEVIELVEQHRLVSLVGAGGVGKTRLALHVAASVTPRFQGGVWLVELATVASGDSIIEAVRRSIRIPDGGQGIESVTDAIGLEPTLIVLDNCEHVLDAVVSAIAMLAGACPGVHFLTTSREPLATFGEVQWRVPSLDLEHATALLMARAKQSSPSLHIEPADQDVLARVCARLDGIPLAIELVAARLGTIPIQDVEGRLLDRFRLLTMGSRAPLARHQTLGAALDWSYQLLTAEEQQMLRRLAAFPGSFEVPAAEYVCADERLDAVDVRDLLESLHAKSLITIDWASEPPRVRRSEIVRQYAAALLDDAELDRLAERHAVYYATLCRHAVDGLRGAARSVWLSRIDLERDQLSDAYEWLVERRPSEAVEMVAGLKEWLSVSDARQWRTRVRELAERDDLAPDAIATSNALRAVLAGGYGFEAASDAAAAAQRAITRLDAVTDPRERVRVLTNLALGYRESDPESATALTERAVAEADALGDRAELVAALLEVLIVHHEHHPVTERLRRRLLDLLDRGAADCQSVHPLVDGALASHQRGHHDTAIAMLDRAEQMLPTVLHAPGIMSDDAEVWALWSVLIRAEVGDTETALVLAEDVLARSGESQRLHTKALLANYG